ncbi:DUF333 domain-containing protein [Brenneria populi subsp. brevivirga]|uniref:putative hemolysin n=1 Tax=Brenneria populi TaxID=1505588 RepID=UPI002E192A1C|nr:DUF333 domain-containing protein [Brenneria populi subsp. brevivirga]
MKTEIKLAGVFIALTVVVGCRAGNDAAPPKSIGMANPASVHCQKQGGRSEMVNTDSGVTGYCLLPSGERIEEWALYRRDNKK